MEQNEYRARRALTSKRNIGTAVGALETADLVTLDAVNHASHVLNAPTGAGQTLAAVGLAVGGGCAIRLRHRRSEQFRRHQRRTASEGWATRQDIQTALGEPAARKMGRVTRPSLQPATRGEQLRRLGTRSRQHVTEFGVPLGSIRSGGRSVRGRPLVANWEQNMLCYGISGSGKSTLLSGIVGRTPGASVVISTKDEFVRATGRLRQLNRGPVRIWDLRGRDADPELHQLLHGDVRFRWNLVRACGDPTEASRRAAALVSTVGTAGDSSEMFQQKSEHLVAALLVAAARAGKGIDKIASWVTNEEFAEPAKILERFSDLPDHLISSLKQLTATKSDKTSGSIALTASTCFGFLSSQTLVDEMTPASSQETDLEELIRSSGTLYVIADKDGSTRPAVAAVFDEARRAAGRVAARRGTRLDPPMSVIADEIQVSLRGVPIDEWAAEMRSTGVWMGFSLQDRSQLEAAWGEAKAKTIEHNLHYCVITGAPQGQWEHYSDLVGKRKETHVTGSYSRPVDTRDKMTPKILRKGNTRQESTAQVEQRVLEPNDLGHLAAREALVLPSQGSPAIIEFPQNWDELSAETNRAEHRVGNTGEQQKPDISPNEQPTGTGSGDEPHGPHLRVVPDDETEERVS